MTAPVVIVDTNVVVSGLITHDPTSPTARILDGMLNGRVRYLLSVELLAEYREVLLRRRIRARHGLDEGEIDTILTALSVNAIICEPAPVPREGPDQGDLHLWALRAAWPGAVLVTGDLALFEGVAGPTLLLPPARFVDLLET